MLSQVPSYAQWVVSILIKGPEEKDCKRCSNRGNNKSEIQPYNQIMPRLPGCLFKFIQKQPPQKSYWCKKTDEVFLEISHNIHKESICVRVSFLRFTKKETLAQLFSCEFCKISKNTFFTEQLLRSWGLLLLFTDISFTFLSPFCSQLAIGTLYIVCLFYNLTIFMIAVAIFPVFYIYLLFPKLYLFPALYLCPVPPFLLLTER